MAGSEYIKFIPKLTKRELEVIETVLSGALRYKSIASSLNISVNTVKTHLRKIYLTVGVNNIEALASLFHGYSSNITSLTPKSPQKNNESPQKGDKNQSFFAVIFHNIIFRRGKKMQNLKVLRKRTVVLISLVSVIALAIGFMAINTVSRNLQNNTDYGMTAETVPEGIRLVFSNVSNIPPEIDTLVISFDEWLGSEEPDLEGSDAHTFMNSVSNSRVSQTWWKEKFDITVLEQVKQTGTVIFPFVQSGHKYTITAIFVNDKLPIPDNIVNFITTECVADGGIYLDNNIALNFNHDYTGVSLSGKPVFTNNVKYEKMQFSIVLHKGDYTEAIGTYTDDLSWNFEPKFSEHLKEAGVSNGNYMAIVGANIHVIYNNISWLLDIACTPVFIYSL